MITKFCCCDLRRGIMIYSIISWLGTGLYLILTATVWKECEEGTECRTPILISFGSFVLASIMTGCLLVGAYKRSRGLLLPYLILQGVCLAIITILIFLTIFAEPKTIILLPGLGVSWYFWVAVFYYYQYLHPAHPLYPEYREGSDKSPPPYSARDENEAMKI